jgi:enoyl-CoA hydratase/carnithine racemase
MTIHATASPGVLTLTLDRPAAKNALDLGMVAGLRRALAELPRDVRVVVLKSAVPGYFSIGMDLGALEAGVAGGADAATVHAATTAYVALLKELIAVRALPIAEIGGMAVGGGVDLVAACDLAIAAEGTAFSIAQLRKGIFPLTTSGLVIPRIGQRAFLYWMLTGQNYPAAKVRRLGLINDVAPAAELSARVAALVDRIRSYDGETLGLGIEAMRQAPHLAPLDRLDHLGVLLSMNCLLPRPGKARGRRE